MYNHFVDRKPIISSKAGRHSDKSVYHMSMRELRDTLEALQTRNADLEDKDFETEQLKLKVDQLQHKLEVTDDDLLKCRKKCKRLHLELSEVMHLFYEITCSL